VFRRLQTIILTSLGDFGVVQLAKSGLGKVTFKLTTEECVIYACILDFHTARFFKMLFVMIYLSCVSERNNLFNARIIEFV
jgi:hypothetical protein